MNLSDWVAIISAVIALAALLRGELQHRRRAPEDAQRAAIEHVVDALDEVRGVIENADVAMPSAMEISTVMKGFERKSQRWEPMLPLGARHIRVSVRQAMAHCFGEPALAAFDPEASAKPIQRFDRYWWDVGHTYIEHASSVIGYWLVDDRRRPLKLVPYSEWRRGEDVAAMVSGYRTSKMV